MPDPVRNRFEPAEPTVQARHDKVPVIGALTHQTRAAICARSTQAGQTAFMEAAPPGPRVPF